ncbi:hypothetical protein ABPG75_003963 [Micractinium tetrahymenae]
MLGLCLLPEQSVSICYFYDYRVFGDSQTDRVDIEQWVPEQKGRPAPALVSIYPTVSQQCGDYGFVLSTRAVVGGQTVDGPDSNTVYFNDVPPSSPPMPPTFANVNAVYDAGKQAVRLDITLQPGAPNCGQAILSYTVWGVSTTGGPPFPNTPIQQTKLSLWPTSEQQGESYQFFATETATTIAYPSWPPFTNPPTIKSMTPVFISPGVAQVNVALQPGDLDGLNLVRCTLAGVCAPAASGCAPIGPLNFQPGQPINFWPSMQ